MISVKMQEMVKNSSAIRAMFEEGKKLAAKVGAENVYDFSLGNPSVEPPVDVKEAIKDIIENETPNLVHGYMNNSGYEDVRESVAQHINKKFGTNFSAKNIIMTVGAAGGLNVILKTLLNDGEEVMTFAPFFSEYTNYCRNHGGVLVAVPANTKDFMPDINKFKEMVTPKTRAVIINNPNNPTGVVYPEEVIKALAAAMDEKQREFGTDIYLISDEPYRELVYDGVNVPYLTKYYANTIIGYSYSKSLSLPGERIGYLVIPDEVADFDDVVSAANVANRILGFVNAPSLIQRVVARCLDSKVNIEAYDRNRRLLVEKLTEYGFEFVRPQGAFYMFIKTPGDEAEFIAAAKKYNLLLVPGSSFGCGGYVRISYCVDHDMILRSLPSFEKLAKEYERKNENDGKMGR